MNVSAVPASVVSTVYVFGSDPRRVAGPSRQTLGSRLSTVIALLSESEPVSSSVTVIDTLVGSEAVPVGLSSANLQSKLRHRSSSRRRPARRAAGTAVRSTVRERVAVAGVGRVEGVRLRVSPRRRWRAASAITLGARLWTVSAVLPVSEPRSSSLTSIETLVGSDAVPVGSSSANLQPKCRHRSCRLEVDRADEACPYRSPECRTTNVSAVPGSLVSERCTSCVVPSLASPRR